MLPKLLLVSALAVALFAGCIEAPPTATQINAGNLALPTQTQTPTTTPQPTQTRKPTATAAPSATAPSATPQPSVTPYIIRRDGTVPAIAINYPPPFGVRGDTGYVIVNDTLLALNLSNPIEPDIVWQGDNRDGPVGDALLVDDLLLLLVGEELLIWNVVEPGLPVLAGRVPAPAGAQLSRAGDRLYLYRRTAENLEITSVSLTDLTDESARVTAAIPWDNPYAFNIAFSHDRLALAQPSGITIYDLADPAAASLLATLDLAVGSDTTVQFLDGRLFVGTGYDLIIYELGPAGDPIQIGLFAELPFTHVLIASDTAYLFTQICGWEENEEGEVKGGCGYSIQVVDISDSHYPASQGYLRVETDANQHLFGRVALLGRYLYLGADVRPGEEPQYYLVDLAATAD